MLYTRLNETAECSYNQAFADFIVFSKNVIIPCLVVLRQECFIQDCNIIALEIVLNAECQNAFLPEQKL